MAAWQIEVTLRHAAWGRHIRVPQRFAHDIASAVRAELCLPGSRAEVSLILAGDGLLRRLNRRYRSKDAPTNVLSFPQPRPGRPHETSLLGDVVLAYQTVRREAAAEGKPLAAHASHLIVHGLLHLLGYDHDDAAAARRMEALETGVLARLGIADPYVKAVARRSPHHARR
jgi:probable rRNA maturation factor